MLMKLTPEIYNSDFILGHKNVIRIFVARIGYDSIHYYIVFPAKKEDIIFSFAGQIESFLWATFGLPTALY